jgi:hypothetical protein
MDLPDGVSYVDDCSWSISFTSADEFQRDARTLLDRVHAGLTAHGFDMDEAKTDVAWIFASERSRGPSKGMEAGVVGCHEILRSSRQTDPMVGILYRLPP